MTYIVKLVIWTTGVWNDNLCFSVNNTYFWRDLFNLCYVKGGYEQTWEHSFGNFIYVLWVHKRQIFLISKWIMLGKLFQLLVAKRYQKEWYYVLTCLPWTCSSHINCIKTCCRKKSKFESKIVWHTPFMRFWLMRSIHVSYIFAWQTDSEVVIPVNKM